MSADTTAKVFLAQLSACVHLAGQTELNGKSVSRFWIQVFFGFLTDSLPSHDAGLYIGYCSVAYIRVGGMRHR